MAKKKSAPVAAPTASPKKKKAAPAETGSPKKKGSTTSSAKGDGFNFADSWRENREKDQSNDGIADIVNGKYTADVGGATSGQTGEGVYWFNIELTVDAGNYEGTELKDRYFLNNDMNVQRFLKTLQTLGYETAGIDPEALGDLAAEIAKSEAKVRIAVKTTEKDSKKYQNVYINGLVGE